MSDSGANIYNAISRFENIKHIPCAGHRLNLCINNLFKIKKIKTRKEFNIESIKVKDFNFDGKILIIFKL